MGLRTVQKKEVLETIGRYGNGNKIPTPFRGGVPGDDFCIRFKRTHKLSPKSHKALKRAENKSYLSHRNF